MLVAGYLLDLPSAYYTLLRIVVSATAVWLAIQVYAKARLLSWFLVATALLFNPLIPVYFGTRDLWLPWDTLAIVLLVLGGWFSRRSSSLERSN
jgi:hypothetical protein